MYLNKTDSSEKNLIDNWYKNNITSYTEKLEDTVWWNDRTLVKGSLLSKDESTGTSNTYGSYQRTMNTFKPELTCTNIRDCFTVDSKNENGKLTYPVGLLTADEYTLAGSGYKGYSTSTYLHTGEYQWTMSLHYFYSKNSRNFVLYSTVSTYAAHINVEKQSVLRFL